MFPAGGDWSHGVSWLWLVRVALCVGFFVGFATFVLDAIGDHYSVWPPDVISHPGPVCIIYQVPAGNISLGPAPRWGREFEHLAVKAGFRGAAWALLAAIVLRTIFPIGYVGPGIPPQPDAMEAENGDDDYTGNEAQDDAAAVPAAQGRRDGRNDRPANLAQRNMEARRNAAKVRAAWAMVAVIIFAMLVSLTEDGFGNPPEAADGECRLDLVGGPGSAVARQNVVGVGEHGAESQNVGPGTQPPLNLSVTGTINKGQTGDSGNQE